MPESPPQPPPGYGYVPAGVPPPGAQAPVPAQGTGGAGGAGGATGPQTAGAAFVGSNYGIHSTI